MFRLAGSQPTAFTASAISRWPCGMPARAMCSASALIVILGPGAASRRSPARPRKSRRVWPVSYTHLRAHDTRHDLVCRLLLEKKKKKRKTILYKQTKRKQTTIEKNTKNKK